MNVRLEGNLSASSVFYSCQQSDFYQTHFTFVSFTEAVQLPGYVTPVVLTVYTTLSSHNKNILLTIIKMSIC